MEEDYKTRAIKYANDFLEDKQWVNTIDTIKYVVKEYIILAHMEGYKQCLFDMDSHNAIRNILEEAEKLKSLRNGNNGKSGNESPSMG